MKKLLVFAAAFAILIAGCSKPEGPKTETKPKELADPELSIAVVPAAAIESGTSFTFTVSTKSSGAITITVDKPTVASVQTVGDREYKITASSPQDCPGFMVQQHERAVFAQTYALRRAGRRP